MIAVIAGCDDCKDINCYNGGRCNVGECVCPTGYSGTFCENDACFNVACLRGTKEFSADSTSCSCVCDSGWYGIDCGLEDFCITNGTVCINGGTCDPTTGNCICPEGFEGDSCEHRSYEKYIGLYQVFDTCGTDTGIVFKTFQSSINPGAAANRVYVSNFNALQIQIQGVATRDFLALPQQYFGLYELLEGAAFHNDLTDNLALEYDYIEVATNRRFNCRATYFRQ